MKKLLFISLLLLGISSCKKENQNNRNNETKSALIFGTADGKIVKINDDGTGKSTLISTDYNWLVAEPKNGKFIYNKETLNNNIVYLYDLNTNISTKIIEENSNYNYTGVGLSNSGDKIILKVYDKNWTGSPKVNIAIVDIDGSNLQVLTTNQDVHENVPVFSPDDSKIAFYSNENLYIVNTDGTNLKKLDTTAIYADESGLYINWNSDGSKIAYITYGANFFRNLNIINTDGTGKTELTTSKDIYDPIWSKDNSKIIFSNGDISTDFANIFIINQDGSGLTNLTNSTAVNRYYTSPEYNSDNTKLSYVEKYFDPNRINDDDVLVSLFILNSTNNTKVKISTNDLGYPYKAFWIK